jgi:hypothetical protein
MAAASSLFVAHRHNWGEDRVHLYDENGKLFSLPAGWTDVAAPDPFVVVAAGRCPFTAEGLPLIWRACSGREVRAGM